jgi:hypothetical protein
VIKKTGIVVAAVALLALGCISTVLLQKGLGHRAAYRGVECWIGDIANAKTSKEQAILRVVGDEWMSRAQVCSIGGFTIVVPAAQTDGHIINIYKGAKPVFQRTRDGSFDYSPTVPDRRIDQMVVNFWHPCEGDVTRLFYTTRGNGPVVQIGDLNFHGGPDTRTILNGQEIAEEYGMYQDAWHRIDKGKMLLDGKWQSMRFRDGEWRIGDPSDPKAASNSDDSFHCQQ